MTEISALGARSASTPTSRQESAPTALASDFETFLKMLTAQARYQDPLEPIDSTEYAAQLAQFSMVEQQVQTNDALARLHQELGVSTLATLSGWIGKDARAQIPATFNGTAITVFPQTDSSATKAHLVVTDSAGKMVQRLEIPTSDQPFQWTGISESGSPLPTDTYTLSVESYNQDELVLAQAPEIYGRVQEVQSKAGEAVLFFEGGQSVSATDITALRDPV